MVRTPCHIRRKMYFPIANWFVDYIGSMYLAICTPANRGEEFVLAENSYNITEGPTAHHLDQRTERHITFAPTFHWFGPVSPRLMLVIRSNFLPEPVEDANPEVKEMRRCQRTSRRKDFME